MFKLLFLLLFISNNCFAQEVKFHKAETKAEKTLDIILRLNDGNKRKTVTLEEIKEVNTELYHFLSANKNKKIYNQKVNDLMLTKELSYAILMVRTEGEKDCLPGDQCPPDYDILSCSQDDTTENNLYITELTQNNIKYIITQTKRAVYQMINIGDQWKLDGISCLYILGNDNYNYKYKSIYQYPKYSNRDSDK